MRLHAIIIVLAFVYHASSLSAPLVAVRYSEAGRDLIKSEKLLRNVSTLEKRIDPITLGTFPLTTRMTNKELFRVTIAGKVKGLTLGVTCLNCYTSGSMIVSTTQVKHDLDTEILEIFTHPIDAIVDALGLDLKIEIRNFFAHFEFDISFAAQGTYTVNIWPPNGQAKDPEKQGLPGSNFIGLLPALDLVFVLDAGIDLTTGFEVSIPYAYLTINPILGKVVGQDFSRVTGAGIPVHIIAGSACIAASLRFSLRAGLQVEVVGDGIDFEAGVFLDALSYKACLKTTPQCGVMFTESLFVAVGVYARAVAVLNYKSLSVGPTAVRTVAALSLPSTCVKSNTPPAFPTPTPTPTPVAQPPCSPGLLICQVEDPTRLEAPWKGVSAPFPQCYDPALYNCSSSFLCPINSPKIPGRYACGLPQPPCGAGLLICQVEDPTRIEPPWHGVSKPFPQCYDPALYLCASNFLCPINAPKIDGQYACGPYGTVCKNWTTVPQTITLCQSDLDWCPSSLVTSEVIPQTVCADITPSATRTAFSSGQPTTISSPVSLSIFTTPIVSTIETVNIYTEVYTRSVYVTTTIISSYLIVETLPIYVAASSSYTINVNSTTARFSNTTTSLTSGSTFAATSGGVGAITTSVRSNTTATAAVAVGAVIASVGGFA